MRLTRRGWKVLAISAAVAWVAVLGAVFILFQHMPLTPWYPNG